MRSPRCSSPARSCFPRALCQVNLMSTETKSSSQHNQEGRTSSTTTVADGILAKKGIAKIFKGIEMVLDESTTVDGGSRAKKGRSKIFKGAEMIIETIISAVARSVIEKILEITFYESRKRNEEETTKAVESKTDETPQELIKTMKALQEYLKESKESGQRECQHSRAQPEGNRGENEGENSSATTIRNFQQLSQRLESLEERLQQMVESS
ncbi:uncharacterized protein [Taeniopygia guttata]|uniref:uncharacterized protein isoform X1 n=1 Tax=Taeniopygia guttata TaxID=59729 RepID=UPI003BB8B96A